MDNTERLEKAATAWQVRKNSMLSKVGWRFGTDHARIKLKKPYPSLQE
jgi:hypothetical protein